MSDSRIFVRIEKARASVAPDPFGPLPQPSARLQLSKTTFGPEIEIIGKDWDGSDVVNVTLAGYPHAEQGAVLGLGEIQADGMGRISQTFLVWFIEPTPMLEESAFTNWATLSIKSTRDQAEPAVSLQIQWYWFFP